MPGVPSYRGCNACLRQKKKCDKAKPSCSRCKRLKIACLGTGNLRFRFKDQSESFILVNSQAVVKRSAAGLLFALCNPGRPLSNDSSLLVNEVVSLLHATDIGQDIKCAGMYLPMLPQRLGYHAALDASAVAFASTITCVRTNVTVSELTRSKYINAINAVQKAVTNTATAYTAETLCAILLLVSCQGWMAANNDVTPSHGGGMAHLLDVLLDADPRRDGFNMTVVRTATMEVVMESIFNPSIRLQPWIHKLINRGLRCRVPALKYTAGNTVEVDDENFMWITIMDDTNLLSVPDLLRHPTKNLNRVQELYDILRHDYKVLLQFRETYLPPKSLITPLPPPVVSTLACCNEIQSIVLAVGISLNAILRAQYPNKAELQREHVSFCADIIVLAEDLKMELPMGAVYLPLTLTAAWLASKDPIYREKLKQLFDDYKGGYAMSELIRRASHWKNAPESLVRELSWFPRFTSAEPNAVSGTNEETDKADGVDSVLPVQPCNGCCFL